MADKTIYELPPRDFLDGGESLVVESQEGTWQTGFPAVFALPKVRKRYLRQAGGTEAIEYRESETITFQDLVDATNAAQTDGKVYPMHQLSAEVMAIGGGGSGGQGAAAFGGNPGCVNIVEISLADFVATDTITMAIGAGGVGSAGGATYVNFAATGDGVGAGSGSVGGNTLADYKRLYAYTIGVGVVLPDVTAGDYVTPDNPKGPGAGGTNLNSQTNAYAYNGGSGYASENRWALPGGLNPGEPGWDAPLGSWKQVGGGGAANPTTLSLGVPTGPGGAGGNPGGGGGAGTVGGPGAPGAARFKMFVWELVL